MTISVSPALITEMDSLIRTPASTMTVERFLPEWTQEVAGNNDYEHGHAAIVIPDTGGAGEDTVFRARASLDGKLYLAIITEDDLDNPSTWDGFWYDSGVNSLVDPAWSANSGANYGGSLAIALDTVTELVRVFYFLATGAVGYTDFEYDGLLIGSGTVANVAVDASMQLGATKPDEVFILRHDLVENSLAAWHKPVYGSYLYRYTYSAGWSVDSNPFLFHTHAEAHAVKDGSDYDAGSANIEQQWGKRPCGGMAVNNIDDNTVAVSLGMTFFFRWGYNTHNQGLMTFLYHRDNGVWERGPEMGVADYARDMRYTLDVFARGSQVEGRNIVVWSRNDEPIDQEQIDGQEFIPRLREVVYARLSDDGRNLTQFQRLGPQTDLTAANIVVVNHNNTKALYALGWQAVYSSPPAGFLCDVPAADKLDMGLYTNQHSAKRDNRWSMGIQFPLVDASIRFQAGTLLREGNLVRVYHGTPAEQVQIAQGLIDSTAPDFSLAQRSHKGPVVARAEKMLLDTRAEAVDDILPQNTLTIVPEDPGGRGDHFITSDGIEYTTHHPIGVALHTGAYKGSVPWTLAKAKWPALFFPGTYPSLEGKLIYRMFGFPWAYTGGGPVDLPPGVEGGPGDIADDRKMFWRGSFFRDIVWTTLPARTDGAIQASVRFGDNRNYGNFSFDALTGCDVYTNIYRSNGLIQRIDWHSQSCGSPPGDGWPGDKWNEVWQESVMAGLICRGVRGQNFVDETGKKYAFIWEANSNLSEGSHLEDQAGRFWGNKVFNNPDYGAFAIGRNKLYLILSDFDDDDENWQANDRWVNRAIVGGIDATGLTPGLPADLKMQILGGTIHCFYRPYPTGTNPKNPWRYAFSHNAGRFGAGKLGLVGRGHSGIQWDALWPGRHHIDQTDNVVDFWDVEATDCVMDIPMEDVIKKYAWQGLTETEFRSTVNDPSQNVVAGTYYNGYNEPVANLCIDFTITLDADGGEGGVFLRAVDNADPYDDCISLGIVVHSTYYDGGTRVMNCHAVKRRWSGGTEDLAGRDYSPAPFQLKPNTPYRCRVTVRNDLYSIWIEGNYVGHFKDATELGQYFGLFATGANATFTNVRVPELHEIPEYALLDVNQTMQDAIRDVIGKRRIKGVWRPYGKLLVSYFSDHDAGLSFENSLQRSQYAQSDRFFSVVKVEGAYTHATYASPTLLSLGRRFAEMHNPDIMTSEACYREAKAIMQEVAERMEQATFVGLPDVRVEPEDGPNFIVAEQSVNGVYLVDDVTFNFRQGGHKQKPLSEMILSTRQQIIL